MLVAADDAGALTRVMTTHMPVLRSNRSGFQDARSSKGTQVWSSSAMAMSGGPNSLMVSRMFSGTAATCIRIPFP